MKYCLWNKFETDHTLKNKKMFDPFIIISMYADAGISLEITKGIKFDKELYIYYRNLLDEFNRQCAKREVSEEDYKLLKTQFENQYIKTSDIVRMKETCNLFFRDEINLTEEDLIRKNKISIDRELGVFGIDVLALKHRN